MPKRVPVKEKKTNRLEIVMSDADRKILEDNARNMHLSVSSFIRTVCLVKPTTNK
jgi:hypothetical protein